ncbi:MAG: hypothetical protein QOC82_2133 [Frankiaceae bacterium]|nr:hypothetical protein [Frankiaceae bacterium]
MFVLVLVGCAVFGAADQYVGSLTRFWAQAWQVPALSAPWLLLPFLVGRTQRDLARAAILGGAGTLLALVAYGAMTISPIEHAAFTLGGFLAFARSNALWFFGAVVTGPLFGYLGHRWRVARAPVAAVLVAGAVMVEPLVHGIHYPGVPVSIVPFGPVTVAELACGLAMAAWFTWQRRRAATSCLAPGTATATAAGRAAPRR